MTRSELLLGPDAVSAAPDGIIVSIRQPWYRSLPLSSVVDVELAIDGADVPREDIVFELDGERYRLDDLPDRWQTVWFIQDAARLRVPSREQDRVHVDVALTLRFPYIIIEGVGPLERRTVAAGDFDLAGRRA